jgi:poly(3-hydroxybutyrate) depolymerase
MIPLAVRTEITDAGGFIISAATGTGTGADTSGTGVWHVDDFPAVDLIVACTVQNYNIDPRRIYSTGANAGGLHSGVMAFQRAAYLAAVTTNSGGLTLPGQATLQAGATHAAAVMTMHGAAGTDVVAISFATASMTLDTQVKQNAGYAINCDHGGAHAGAPAALQTAAWQFMKDHPFGITPEPYGASLPAIFPSYCVIK